jgi:transposase
LLPPDLREWLPEDHLARAVLDAVACFDLTPFTHGPAEPRGRASYHPGMMVALLLYAYCLGVFSSREIERRCQVDIAFRLIAGNRQPDHTTIARFRARYEHAMTRLFTDVLKLCAKAGMVNAGLVALDSTKMAADASKRPTAAMSISPLRSMRC